MILEQVNALSTKYNIKSTVDLSKYSWSTDYLLKEALEKLKELEFADDTRIVFYHSAPLDKSFDELPADMLIKLQMLLAEVDIPNYFCIVITDVDLTNELDYLCTKYAVDEKPMINIICSK